MADVSDLLKYFKGRDESLRGVTRYSLYKTMFYRSNLLLHSYRVAAIVRYLNPLAQAAYGAKYNPAKAELLAYIHDDAETIFGDIQAGNKREMTPGQLAEVHRQEQAAIDQMGKKYPHALSGQAYGDLLHEATDYKTIEAQVSDFADKYDAQGEALHEVYAGNTEFTYRHNNEYGQIVTPPEYYVEWFAHVLKKLPGLVSLLKGKSPIYVSSTIYDYAAIAASARPHTQQSIFKSTGNVPYDTWRAILLRTGDPRLIKPMYTSIESPES